MRRTLVGGLCLALCTSITLLSGCDGGSRGSNAATSAAAPVASAVSLSQPASEAGAEVLIPGLPAGAEVFLVQPDPEARDLRALADTILDVCEADARGALSFAPQAAASPQSGLEVGLEVLVSAEGYALTRAPWRGSDTRLALTPEARVELVVRAGEAAAELAFALVLDANGVPLPVPVASCVSDASGALLVTRLPAGSCELLIASPDLERMALLRLDVASGQTYRREVILEQDDALTRRFLVITGGPEVAAAIGENQ